MKYIFIRKYLQGLIYDGWLNRHHYMVWREPARGKTWGVACNMHVAPMFLLGMCPSFFPTLEGKKGIASKKNHERKRMFFLARKGRMSLAAWGIASLGELQAPPIEQDKLPQRATVSDST